MGMDCGLGGGSTVGGEGLRGHEAYACAAACDETDGIFHGEEVGDV